MTNKLSLTEQMNRWENLSQIMAKATAFAGLNGLSQC